jgi:hypothetical protein
MPLHVIPQICKALLADPVVTSAVLVLTCGRVPMVLDLRTIPFGESGPTTSAMVMVPIRTRAFPPTPLERSALQVLAGLDAPLLIFIHDAMISSATAKCGESATDALICIGAAAFRPEWLLSKVNCDPWSLSKISGRPPSNACFRAARQKSISNVTDSTQLSTNRLNQSITATNYTNPPAIRMYVVSVLHT